MSAKSIVVLSEDISAAGKAILKNDAELVVAPDTTEATITRLLSDADGLILRASTKITREVLDGARRLRVIARTGVGYNNVDIAAAAEQGIPVTIFPGANENAVAEHAITMILVMAKQIFFMHRSVLDGHWAARFSPNQREIAGQTLGLLGYGNIGKLTAKKALALGMRVVAFDPAIIGTETKDRVIVASHMEDVLAQADFLSLHLPAIPSTRRILNRGRLALMKRAAFLVNTARGELIDETALLAALTEGRLGGAALDVFETEPPPVTSPLFHLPNVILSPHAAGSTFESNERLAVGAAQAVLDVLQGRVPAHVVNPEALTKRALLPNAK